MNVETIISEYDYDVFSHNGEDAVLCHIINEAGIRNGSFIEIGAMDGVKGSNTRFLALHNWTGAMIECDSKFFKRLARNYTYGQNVDTIHAKVSCEEGETLDDVLDSVNFPENPDVLSLDIDGNDYWVLKGLRRKPNVVAVEFNSHFEPHEKMVIDYDPEFVWNGTDYYGASIGAFNDLMRLRGYKLVAWLKSNAFFVLDKYDIPEIDVSSVEKRCIHRASKRTMIYLE